PARSARCSACSSTYRCAPPRARAPKCTTGSSRRRRPPPGRIRSSGPPEPPRRIRPTGRTSPRTSEDLTTEAQRHQEIKIQIDLSRHLGLHLNSRSESAEHFAVVNDSSLYLWMFLHSVPL